jgi:hypothetical protein
LGLLLQELLQEILSGFSLTLSPLVKNRFEKPFVELSHAPERCSSVEEVKFFVILLVLLTL